MEEIKIAPERKPGGSVSLINGHIDPPGNTESEYARLKKKYFEEGEELNADSI